MERKEMIADGIPTLETGLTADDKGYIEVEITANVTAKLMEELERTEAEIIASLPEYRSITARVPIATIESLAAMDEIIFIMPKQEAMLSQKAETPILNLANLNASVFDDILTIEPSSNVEERARNVRNFISSNFFNDSRPETGSVTSQGDVTHRSNIFRSATGLNGAGIKIGVLSDGVNTLAARQATGDLPPGVTVLPGQAGSGDEGTAMLEIAYDIAPGAQLYFATAKPSPAQFAQNIRNLRAVGCNIIIDDWSYFGETAFQNGQTANVNSNTNSGVVVQAVNDVTVGSQAGALYFSSAGNFGNKNDDTAGVWEGNFVDGGNAIGIPGNLHNFGGAIFDTITASASGTNPIVLQWSDPLGGSGNNYDLFVLNSAGTQILATSNNLQNGTQDPIEWVPNTVNVADNLVVITKVSGSGRFLHLNTNGGKLAISTSGVVFGHNAGLNTISIAASPAASPTPGGPIGPFPNSFNSSNQVERFSSDGPRRIFYNADSSPITPGNVSSTGGQLLQKPDITAADGVTTTTPGFSPFFGTSAAAPHAGALAALLKSACPSSTNAQLINAMKSTAIDIEAAGTDRDSGAGIFMPIPAQAALCSLPCPTTAISVGQVINGSLTTSDCVFSGTTRYVDVYTLNGINGQNGSVSMNSTAVDSYLYIVNSSNQVLYQDDNGGGGMNSRIVFTLPATGTYQIYATSSTAGQTGNYSLTLTAPAPTPTPTPNPTPTVTPTPTPSPSPSPSPTPVVSTLEGDVVDANGNPGGDGLILSNDVAVLRQFVLGTRVPANQSQFNRADVNGTCGDGSINSADVTVIRQFLLGNLTPSPTCNQFNSRLFLRSIFGSHRFWDQQT